MNTIERLGSLYFDPTLSRHDRGQKLQEIMGKLTVEEQDKLWNQISYYITFRIESEEKQKPHEQRTRPLSEEWQSLLREAESRIIAASSSVSSY